METMLTISRYHDISAGHRVVGHEGKCQSLHGHNYRIHFECVGPKLDKLGRVIDFSVIKSRLCEWLETEWDHKMLLWDNDPLFSLRVGDFNNPQELGILIQSICRVPFNPTAEQMADYLLTTISPKQLEGTGIVCSKVTVEETRKCSACARLTPQDIARELIYASYPPVEEV